MSDAGGPPEISKETVRQVSVMQQEFIRDGVEGLRAQVTRMRPLLAKRSKMVAENSDLQGHFWRQVFAHAPPTVDEFFLGVDAAIMAKLEGFEVEHMELKENGEGEPRSFQLTFTFPTGEANPFFTDAKLVKKFWWRKQVQRNSKGHRRTWEGLVSEPVRIQWKEGMDPTRGLLGKACDLWDAEQNHKGDRIELEQYKTLAEAIAEVEKAAEIEDVEEPVLSLGAQSPANTSFFAFFGFRGRDVSAEHSKEATKEEDERFAKMLKGEEVEDEDEDEDDEDDDEFDDSVENVEVFQDGEDIAINIAEEIWPNALKLYTESFDEALDFDESDIECESCDEDEEEDADERPRKKVKA
ncbi:hypothetical protein FE257_012932 [Aspergillus nanangensis]|uniref:NAP family protein n=1 Tax=Aspergillus nanangensis TaxID=2582783 RepID=A0AAD4CF75_ASPNN|nr:hypothetical protein FE257_012932 [Aspergillus nanangensis]